MWWPDLDQAALLASCRLGVPVRLCGAHRPLRTAALTPSERAVLRGLRTGPRRRDWLLGRAALRLLPAVEDTAAIAFPDARLSLTHGGGVAVAARCDGTVEGVGVDFEPWTSLADRRTARFFLREPELGWMEGLSEEDAARARVRLWTIKEALFKATSENDDRSLFDYELFEPWAETGVARDTHGRPFRYTSFELSAGALAVAVAERQDHGPD